MKKIIATNKAPAAIGPYNQAVEQNGILFISGQIPLHPETGKIEAEDIREQTIQVLKNMENILQEAGYGFENVVKTTCYLKNMDDFQVFNQTYAQFFTGDEPARSAVEVSQLPKGALVKIEAMAIK